MRLGQDNSRGLDNVVLVFLLGVFLFLSPFTFWWPTVATVWYFPFLLWIGLVLLIGWVSYRRRDDV